MTVLLISDLHLSSERPELMLAFRRFAEQVAQRAEQQSISLYILGDLCEAWVGSDDNTPFSHQLRNHIKALTQRLPVYLMRGNRDFLFDPAFAEQTGVTLLEDPHPLEVGRNTYLLSHGDSLCIDDRSYMQTRRILRSESWRHDFLALPLSERHRQAALLRGRSELAKSNKPEQIMDVSLVAVHQLMRRYGVRYLVHGHTPTRSARIS